jgi:DNA-binding NarL/FixJ family response regulator
MNLDIAGTRLTHDTSTLSSAKGYKRNKIRVFLITSFTIIHDSLKILIEDNFGINVSGSAVDLNDIGENAELNNSDVVLIYLMDGDNESIEIISELLQHFPKIRIVVVINNDDFINQSRAMELGAIGIVQKEKSARTLINALRQAHSGEAFVDQILLSKLLKQKNTPESITAKHCGFGIASITTREKDVIAMIGEGLNNKEISKRLFISEATVRHHLSTIFRKLEVEDRINLVIYAYQHKLLQISKEMKNRSK